MQGIVVVFVVCGAYLSDSTMPFVVPLLNKHTDAGRLAGIIAVSTFSIVLFRRERP